MNITHLTRDVVVQMLDPAFFRSVLRVDAGGRSVPLGDVMDDWQRADFEVLDNGWRSITGQTVESRTLRAWMTRARGHSKTSDLAVMITWALLTSRQKLSGIVAACDQRQAAFLRDAVDLLVRLNPWLAPCIVCKREEITNPQTGSTCEIITSDAPSSYGHNPSFVICDELTNWPKEDLWVSLFSSVGKRPWCLLIIASNAGFTDSWQAKLLASVQTDDRWYVHSLDGVQASWIDQATLDEQRRLLPEPAFRRLWLNEWSDGAGDALKGADIDAAVIHTGPMVGNEPGWRFVAGLDLSVSRDRSALVITGRHVGHQEEIEHEPPVRSRAMELLIDVGVIEDTFDPYEIIQHEATHKLRLALVRSWEPPRGGKIDLQAIADAVEELHHRFGFDAVMIDPYQAELMGQQLRRAGVPIVLQPFTGSALTEMASQVIEAFTSAGIELYQCEELIADLRRLRIIEKSYGWRLDAPRTAAAGHCDTATALALSLLGHRRIAPNAVRAATDADMPFAAGMSPNDHFEAVTAIGGFSPLHRGAPAGLQSPRRGF